jgi:hypothetical protein
MRFPDTKLTLLWVGLPLSALGLAIVLASPADARKASSPAPISGSERLRS